MDTFQQKIVDLLTGICFVLGMQLGLAIVAFIVLCG